MSFGLVDKCMHREHSEIVLMKKKSVFWVFHRFHLSEFSEKKTLLFRSLLIIFRVSQGRKEWAEHRPLESTWMVMLLRRRHPELHIWCFPGVVGLAPATA